MCPFPSVLFCAIAVGLQAVAFTQPAAPPAQDNYYAAGNHIETMTAMPRDVVVAGRLIEINQSVGGDVLAAGWHVSVTGKADDDVRVAAAEVFVDTPVAGDLTVAGGDVTLGPQTHVAGRSWITGGAIRVGGVLERELRVAGARVQLAGEIRKPVEVFADTLEILPGARILGPLTYRSPKEAVVSESAVVSGPVTFDRVASQDVQRARAFPVLSSFLFSIHVFLAGLLVLLFVPRVEESIVATLRARPGQSLLAGIVFLVTTPVAALLLIVSVLGLPIGLALAALYAVALFGGVLVTAFCLGALEARWLNVNRTITGGQRALTLLAGVLTLALLRTAFGGFAVFVSMLFGLGALSVWTYARLWRGSQPATV